jgi:uncharacterized membrane protein SpoIIM required for sporulation
MKSLKQIYNGMILLVLCALAIGITFGASYTPVGETAHNVINNNPSMTIVNSVKDVDLHFLLMIFINNSLIAGALILLSYGKVLSEKIKYLIYLELGYQIFSVALLIGYVSHYISPTTIITTLLPHGIIEVPIIMLAASYGVYLCQKEVYEDRTTIILKYIFWIVIPLFFAALVEVFITPIVMGMV